MDVFKFRNQVVKTKIDNAAFILQSDHFEHLKNDVTTLRRQTLKQKVDFFKQRLPIINIQLSRILQG